MPAILKWTILIIILIAAGVSIFYLWPIPRMPFERLYAKVEPSLADSRRHFERANPARQLRVNSVTWEYLATGEGPETIVFLHGMTGAHDIWWQQIEALRDKYRTISVTYPPVKHLAELDQGLMAVLDKEGVAEFNLVGTSLGGYFVQYLMARHPERIRRAVLSNTFSPNNSIADANRTAGKFLPVLPEWLLMRIFRGNFQQTIYPTSGHDELTLAFLNEIGHGRMRKGQLLGRYYCVIEKFAAPTPMIPIMIVESDNDPLVDAQLREQLKADYPAAAVHTFSAAGHFPYLNRADEYSRVVDDFLSSEPAAPPRKVQPSIKHQDE